MGFEIRAFHRFFSLGDLETKRAGLKSLCLAHSVVGTMILASEGLNATLAGSPETIAAILAGIAHICHVCALQKTPVS